MSYSNEVLADNPAAYWKLDESSGTATDTSGHGITGTYSARTVLNNPPLIGSGASIQIPAAFIGMTSAGVDLTSGDWAMEVWVKPTTLQLANMLGASTGGYGLSMRDASGNWGVSISAVDDATNASTAIQLNVVNHLVAEFVDSSNTLTYYRNGVALNSPVYATAPTAGRATVDANGIGGTSFAYLGYMDELALYKHTLGATRVSVHYAARDQAAADPAVRPIMACP